VAQLEARWPALARVEGQRLADLRPYYLPARGWLTLFACRWPDGAAIPVELPGDADAGERRALEAALAAWEGAGLGLRFERGARRGFGIEIRLRDAATAYQAYSVVDCAVDAAGLEAAGDVLPARLVTASLELVRGDPRLAGTALHELGHALGFQGHARRGDSVMLHDIDAVRRAGERALAGRPFADAALAALYALPSGAVLGRLALPPGRSQPVDDLFTRASARGWLGPLLRVGDREGRIAWLDPATGETTSLRIGGLEQARSDPARLVLEGPF
jgi:hypothetical protein